MRIELPCRREKNFYLIVTSYRRAGEPGAAGQQQRAREPSPKQPNGERNSNSELRRVTAQKSKLRVRQEQALTNIGNAEKLRF